MPTKRPSLRDRPVLPAVGAADADNMLMGVERRRREVQELPVGEIMPNRRQPRAKPSDEGLDELAASIQAYGVLQPILVQSISLRAYEGRPCRYELIAGERRWRASQRAGRDTIPAIVLDETMDDRQLLVLALIENLQREGLSPLDEGLAFGQLQSDFGLTQHEIAARVGKSRGYVQNRTRLTSVPEDLQQLAVERPDSLVHIYEMARVADVSERIALIAAVRDERISYAETRARVAALLAPPEALATSSDKNDLRKSFADPSPTEPGVPSAPTLSGEAVRGAPAEQLENDLRKSFAAAEAVFLSRAERIALAAVASRLEAGVAVPAGKDSALLVRISLLVAALLPEKRGR